MIRQSAPEIVGDPASGILGYDHLISTKEKVDECAFLEKDSRRWRYLDTRS